MDWESHQRYVDNDVNNAPKIFPPSELGFKRLCLSGLFAYGWYRLVKMLLEPLVTSVPPSLMVAHTWSEWCARLFCLSSAVAVFFILLKLPSTFSFRGAFRVIVRTLKGFFFAVAFSIIGGFFVTIVILYDSAPPPEKPAATKGRR